MDFYCEKTMQKKMSAFSLNLLWRCSGGFGKILISGFQLPALQLQPYKICLTRHRHCFFHIMFIYSCSTIYIFFSKFCLLAWRLLHAAINIILVEKIPLFYFNVTILSTWKPHLCVNADHQPLKTTSPRTWPFCCQC